MMYSFYNPDYYCRPYYPPFYGGGFGGVGGGFGGTGCGMSPLLALLLYLTFRMVRNMNDKDDHHHDNKCCDKDKRHHDDWYYDIGSRDEDNIFGNMSNMPLVLFILFFIAFSGGEGRRMF